VRARIAWVLTAVTFVTVVADVVVTAQYRSLLSEDAVAVHGFPFVDLAVCGCALLGALILAQDDRHPIGLLLLLIGVTSAVSLLGEAYSIWVTSENGPGPSSLANASGWLSTMLGGQLAISGLALMFLLAPDGRLLSRRWRYTAVAPVLGAFLCVVALLTENPTTYDITAEANAEGPFAALMFSLGFLLISVGLLASVASMVVRLRRSHGEVRQQVRLIALSAALIGAGLLSLFVVQIFNGGEQTWAAAVPLFLSYMLLPVLFGVAVLRYRLYDVEVIVNRSLVIILGTAFAAVGYTTLVVTVGSLVDSRTGGIRLSLIGTVVVALAFQPLRRRVIQLASRLAYGSRAQPYEALSDFSHRLAETPSAETLLPAVADAARQAVSARGAEAVLHAHGGTVMSAESGTCGPAAEAQTLAVRYRRDELGSIRVWLPGGARLRPADVRLLEALAGQTAVVFRNVALEAQLAAHVAELDRTTDDLVRSRARLIAADDAARRAMEAAISREVLPHLAIAPDGIANARAAIAGGQPQTGLDELVVSTNTALDALRELTRGLFPTQLTRAGIDQALGSFLARNGHAGALQVHPSLAGRRFSEPVEAAVYSCSVGAVREFVELTAIELSLSSDDVLVVVRGIRRDRGDDVQIIVDRAEAFGGSVDASAHEMVIRIPQKAAPAPVLAGGRDPEV
jgi:hypothetical protein